MSYRSALGAGAMPPAMAAAPPAPPPSMPAPGGPGMGLPAGAPPTLASAEAQHRQKSDQFAKQAVIAFLTGKITRQHLADALAQPDAYDFPKWAASNVIHPSQAGVSAGELPEPPTGPAAG